MTMINLKNNSDTLIKFSLAILLVILAVIMRLLPHWPNFVPISAIVIFGGAILPKRWAISLPLVAMVASDCLIGLHPLIWLTWGSFMVIALTSNLWLKKIRTFNLLGASLTASLFFYVTTNFGVWAQGWLYPKSLSGLIQCYYNALPFLRNTLVSDLLFSLVLFGIYAVICRYIFKTNSLKIVALNQA
jgi:hypothetical protein